MASSIAQWLAYLRPNPAAPGSIPSFTGILSDQKIIDVAEAIQWRRLEESERWLENVDRIHLLLASGNPVLQERKVMIRDFLKSPA